MLIGLCAQRLWIINYQDCITRWAGLISVLALPGILWWLRVNKVMITISAWLVIMYLLVVAVEQGLKAVRVSDAVCSPLEHHEPCSHLAKIIFMCCFGFSHL